ncbi:MAG TPA: fibronectin type III domain-containing protein [Vicinamibacteria bacterium]|nr:fibronectin type III domain-containing protein [Vicinamibacteria bacterium]
MTNRLQALLLFLVACVLAPLVHAQNVVRGPYLQTGTPNGVTVRWRTDIATDSVVRFGSAPGSLTQAASSQFATTEHDVEIAGLLPDTRYFYSVGTASLELAGNNADYFFVTSPVPGESKPTRIWVIGDSGTADNDAARVFNSFLGFTGARSPDLWLMLGDNAYPDGTDAEYQAAVFDMYPSLLRKSVLWPTLGNHDGHEADSASQTGPYYDIFELPTTGESGGVPSGTEAYYSFDYGDIHVVCLDSDQGDTSPDSGMMMWLAADLQNNDRHWLIAFWHHPPYSKGSHDSDGSSSLSRMREDVLPTLEDYGVDLVLSGHSHSYERSYLIDGHYGQSSTFTETHKINGGDGSEQGEGAYQKPFMAGVPHEGAVYTVAGSSGKTSGGSLNHPAMVISLERLGSVVLDVDGVRMDARFLDDAGNILDEYTILKGGGDTAPPSVTSVAAVTSTEVVVSFSERVEPSSAAYVSNYDIDSGVAVTGAVLSGDGLTVTLMTTTLSSGTYWLTVNNVSDLAGNVIVASPVSFDYVSVDSEPPTAPSGLEVVSTTETEVALGWGASTDDTSVTEYVVYKDGSEAGRSTVTSFTATGLTPSTSYDFFVTAVDLAGNESSPSNVVTATTDTPPDTESPSRPGPPTLVSKTDTTVTFTWAPSTDNVRVVAYDVRENSTFVGSTDGSTTTLTHTGLTPETTYSYTVTARDAAGNESLPSDPLNVTTDPAPDTEPPTPPTVTASNTDTTVTLTWAGATDNVAVVAYFVHENGTEVGSTSGSTTTYTLTGLTPETTYSYTVTARDAAGNVSSASNPLNVTTDPSPQLPMQISISLELRQFGPWQTGRALVSVADEVGNPIDGATVTAQWSGLATDTDSGTTTGGTVQLESDKVSHTAMGQFILTVTDVTADGYTFDPAASVSACIDTSGQPCEMGPPPSPISMNVTVEVTLQQQGKNTTATADLIVTDENGPLSDVIVEGDWSLNGEGIGSAGGLTNSEGRTSIDSPRLKASTGDVFRFTVARLIFDGYMYTVNDMAESAVQ